MAELIHTCYRILDIDRSVGFYEKLGFRHMRTAMAIFADQDSAAERGLIEVV